MLLAPLTHDKAPTVPHEGAVPMNDLFIRFSRDRFLIMRRTDWHSVLVGSTLTLEDAIYRLNKWR